jgi:hypothetical protein
MGLQEGKKQKTEQSQADRASATAEKEAPPPPEAISPNGHTSDRAGRDKPVKKLSREERTRQREVAALERERAERRRTIQR